MKYFFLVLLYCVFTILSLIVHLVETDDGSYLWWHNSSAWWQHIQDYQRSYSNISEIIICLVIVLTLAFLIMRRFNFDYTGNDLKKGAKYYFYGFYLCTISPNLCIVGDTNNHSYLSLLCSIAIPPLFVLSCKSFKTKLLGSLFCLINAGVAFFTIYISKTRWLLWPYPIIMYYYGFLSLLFLFLALKEWGTKKGLACSVKK